MGDNRLHIFYTVAQEQHFARAAARLRLTQPAVSLQIRALEEEYGQRLLDRTAQGARLTPAGQRLYRHAGRILALYEEMELELRAAPQLSGELRLGASSTLASYLLPEFLAGFQNECPKVRLLLSSGNSLQVAGWVREQAIPLGFIEGPCRVSGLKTQPLVQDELIVVCGKRFASLRQPFSLADLLSLPLLMREPGSGTRETVEKALHRAAAGPSPHIVMELGSTEALKTAAEQGLGLAIISRWAVQKELRLGSLFPVAVRGLTLRRQLFAIYPQGPAPDGLAGYFLKFLRRELRRRPSGARA